MAKDEIGYLELLRKTIEIGEERNDRTGTGTISIFGEQLRFDISNNIPLLTTKKVAWKTCLIELLWFLRGDTDATNLQKQNVHIWDGNTTREFLDNIGLTHYPVGDVGATYGFSWRHFGAEYKTCKDDYTNAGFDQIQYVLNELQTNPMSRRIYMSAWNPAALHKMALPPCHVSAQFYVSIDADGNKHLSCHLYMRSVDQFLGLPFNIFSYATLTYIFAKKCGMKPKELIISTGDTHIYKDHIDQVNLQLSREPFSFPKLIVNDAVTTKDFQDITVDDFDVIDYNHHPFIKANMSA